MGEQEPRTPVRKRRSRAEAAQVVAEYEVSGLSRFEFCQKRGLRPATFSRYLRRQRQAQGEAAGVDLVAVELCAAEPFAGKGRESGLAVALAGGRRIEVARGFHAPTLVQLLGLLERF